MCNILGRKWKKNSNFVQRKKGFVIYEPIV